MTHTEETLTISVVDGDGSELLNETVTVETSSDPTAAYGHGGYGEGGYGTPSGYGVGGYGN